jgi:hypothetical protein
VEASGGFAAAQYFFDSVTVGNHSSHKEARVYER